MKFIVTPSILKGEVTVPGSKSHTIRALVLGLLAGGESVIEYPLDSSDTRSCLQMVKNFGADVYEDKNLWRVRGLGGNIPAPNDVIDTGNSGTSLYIGLGVAALAGGYTVFTGDHQIRNRPAGPLLAAINDLGGWAVSTRGNDKPPLVIRGRIKGGATRIEAHTSQYLTALLIAAPLAEKETVIDVPLLNEAPYISMTLSWLDRAGIEYQNENFTRFRLPGGQQYKNLNTYIPADFSSATFFLAAAAVTGSKLILKGLDFSDTQGDKDVVGILERMGVQVVRDDRRITVEGGALRGGEFDLNAIPDALPALAVVGCFAEGETRLVNVPQARLKETDRIAVMCAELKKMGADIEERPDGLVIRKSRLTGTDLHGHHDHRVVMALAVAGLAARGVTRIDTAESVSVTFPNFRELMNELNAVIDEIKER